jgi:hypothetical protein
VEISPLGFTPVIYDQSKSPVEHVVDGVNLMDETCQTVSVKRAHNKLTKAVENIDNDNAVRYSPYWPCPFLRKLLVLRVGETA